MPSSLSTPVSPQLQLLINYLKQGRTLTNLIALATLGVGSVSSRIAELRKMGMEIEDEWKEDAKRRRYKTYWLKDNKA